ncbi:MAG: hypothetical protein Fur0018_26660 [Anaerolineales bacterium]
MTDKIEITARENGPYLIPVAGVATATDAGGNTRPVEGSMVALCRCGHSANKPFCDGSHKKADFKAPAMTVTIAATE